MAPVLLLTPQPSRGSSRRGQGRPARPCAHGAFRKLVGEDAGTLETRAVPAGPRRCCSQARVPHLPCGDLGGRASPFFLPPCVAVDSGVSSSREEISERVCANRLRFCLPELFKNSGEEGRVATAKTQRGAQAPSPSSTAGTERPGLQAAPGSRLCAEAAARVLGTGQGLSPSREGWGRARNCPECQRLRGAVFIQGQGTPGSSHSRHGDRRVSGFWRAGRGARGPGISPPPRVGGHGRGASGSRALRHL